MTSAIYLDIDGVKGESSDDQFKNQVEVESFSHGVSQAIDPRVSSSGGGTSARCTHGDLTINKSMDTSTPLLNQKCCTGEHIKKIKLTLCRASGGKGARVPYMVYTIHNAVISNVSITGGGDEVPSESVSFNYAKIEWEYTQQKRSGGLGGGKTTGSWDLQKNKV